LRASSTLKKTRAPRVPARRPMLIDTERYFTPLTTVEPWTSTKIGLL
jgi:hypothetical protein